MKTEALFMEDSYQQEMDAQVIEVSREGGDGWRLILDKTVFYPMGGGQPTDQGRLHFTDWSADVYMVQMKDGEIWHFVKAHKIPQIGDKIHGVLNWERRYKNMRIHSGGHIVDFAMYLLGYSPKVITPIKGDHGKKPYIVYSGMLDEDIRQKLQDKSNELVAKNLQFSWLFQDLDELQKEAIYLQPGLPTDKELRTLRLEGIGSVADGGTQVRYTKEVGQITIKDILSENGMTTVSYGC